MESRLEKIKNETTINWWANGEYAQMLYNSEHNTYQLIRLNKNHKWKVSPPDRNTNNCPVLTKGITSFLLFKFGNSEKEIFDKYYNSCLSEFKNIESAKPGSSLRNLDEEFNSHHIEQERKKISFSQKLLPFLSDEEGNLLNQYAQLYLTFIKNEYGANIESSELSIANWSIVFYYLYAAKELEGTKKKAMDIFIKENNVINTEGILTKFDYFKQCEIKLKNRIEGKTNKYGFKVWSKDNTPLPPGRIKKILPFIKNNIVALKTANYDIVRLKTELDEYKEKHD